MSGTDESDPSELADAVFRILSDEYRRCVLYYLLDRDAATVEELATVATGWVQARESAVEIATPDDRERVRAALHHVHLPRIADAGFVRYDHNSGEVALERVPVVLESILEQSLAEDRTGRDRSEDP
ncbi:transcriptional regulator [Halobacteriales archaeon SW_6_65_15]|jgi:hypothetical protein|nr:MAG: transcriptional regulator [Halobacteriales archaeon SW_6_65_15]